MSRKSASLGDLVRRQAWRFIRKVHNAFCEEKWMTVNDLAKLEDYGCKKRLKRIRLVETNPLKKPLEMRIRNRNLGQDCVLTYRGQNLTCTNVNVGYMNHTPKKPSELSHTHVNNCEIQRLETKNVASVFVQNMVPPAEQEAEVHLNTHRGYWLYENTQGLVLFENGRLSGTYKTMQNNYAPPEKMLWAIRDGLHKRVLTSF